MIRRYLPTETIFNHNKFILAPIRAEVSEEANGMFELEIEVMRDVVLNKGDILSIPTPRGEQPFRVYRITKTLRGKRIFAKHIFYDLAKNFLIDVRPTNMSLNVALNHILTNTETPTSFTGSSDVVGSNTAYYIRKNPVEAIIGAENSLLNLWGGNLVRDGKNIQIKANGNDRGFEIRMGKNLLGIEDESDESGIITKLYPTVELDRVVYALPEKYVDSPQIHYYPDPIIKEVRVELTEEERLLPLADIYVIMRNYCNNLFSVDNIDKPIVNYKVDFVQLKKVAGYEQYQLLEQLDLYDLVKIDIEKLGINLKAKVISYKYDCLGEKYNEIELGGFKSTAKYQTSNIIRQIQNDLVNQKGLIAGAIDYATNVITGNKGGYVVFRNYPDGKPYELLFLDTDNIQTAVEVIRINKSGVGFSHTGYNGPFETAIIAGQLVTGTGFFNSIITNLIQSDIGSSLNLESNQSINLLADRINLTVTQTQVQEMIAAINSANPNLVTNLSENWEQGEINSSNGTLVDSTLKIRNRAYFPIRQGRVYIKVSPLYQAMIVLYNSSYGFKASYGFATEQTFLLDENCYFKVVLKRTNGLDITPDAINTAELKVENSDTATQYTRYWGDMSLEQQQEYFVLTVESDNGWTVDEANFTANFTAKVYLFNEDVTMRFEPLQFTWFKQYPSGALISLGNGTTKTITGASIEKSATISCSFEIYDTIYTLATFNGDTMLTIANDTIMVIGDYQ